MSKKKIKGIISAIIVGVVLIAAFAGINALTKIKTKQISPIAFKVGSVGENGEYVECETSIYTKDLFECQGLSVVPKFEAKGTYQIFYYDYDMNYLGASPERDVSEGTYIRGSDFSFGKYCRIMITPELPEDVEKIAFYETLTYAGDYKITVNKKQNFKISAALETLDNSFEALGTGYVDFVNHTGFVSSNSSKMYFYNVIDVSNYDTVYIKMLKSSYYEGIRNPDNSSTPLPYVYEYNTNSAGKILCGYGIQPTRTLVDETDEFVYVRFDVSNADRIWGFVDVASKDIAAIYLR